MLRICYTIDSPYAGGAERYLSLLLGGLDSKRFESSVIVTDAPGLDDWCDEHARRGVPVTRVPMRLPFRPLDFVPILRALRSHDAHLVHVNAPGPYDGQMGLLAPLARLAGARGVVVTEHLPMVERLWKRALVKSFAANWLDCVVTICHANVDYLRERQGVPESRIHVVYNGIPAEFGTRRDERRPEVRRRLGLDEGTTGLVFAGSLIERKGVGVLLEALAGAAPPSWKLFVLGEGEERARYEADASRLGIAGKVEFLGHVDAGQVEDIYCAADALILPSFMEGMPYVILEAMACSLPVIASRIHGIPEAVADGGNGLLVPPGDPTSLRDAVVSLAANRAMRESMGKNARKRFEELFTLRRHLSAMEALYMRIADGTPFDEGAAR